MKLNKEEIVNRPVSKSEPKNLTHKGGGADRKMNLTEEDLKFLRQGRTAEWINGFKVGRKISQQENERLKQEAADDLLAFNQANAVILKYEQTVADRRTLLRELAEALRESLSLGNYAVLSEESSSSHYHGPKAAAKYAEKTFALEQKIRAALREMSEALRLRFTEQEEKSTDLLAASRFDLQ